MAFGLQDTMWPSGRWTLVWRDVENSWEITKQAYMIIRLRAQNQKHLPGVPRWLREEVYNNYEELCALPRCLTCHLPQEFCTA